jgi:hypothetical protein
MIKELRNFIPWRRLFLNFGLSSSILRFFVVSYWLKITVLRIIIKSKFLADLKFFNGFIDVLLVLLCEKHFLLDTHGVIWVGLN